MGKIKYLQVMRKRFILFHPFKAYKWAGDANNQSETGSS
jgi:hypothetical protein